MHRERGRGGRSTATRGECHPKGQEPQFDFEKVNAVLSLCSEKTQEAFGEGPAGSGPGIRGDYSSWSDLGAGPRTKNEGDPMAGQGAPRGSRVFSQARG